MQNILIYRFMTADQLVVHVKRKIKDRFRKKRNTDSSSGSSDCIIFKLWFVPVMNVHIIMIIITIIMPIGV